MLNIVYAGTGTNLFCVNQTVKSYELQVDNRQVETKVVDNQTLFSAITEQGPVKKWLTIPGGHAIEIAKHMPEEALQKIQSIWNKEASSTNNLDLIGICAGAIVLGGCEHYGQLMKQHMFEKTRIRSSLQINPYKIAFPILPYNHPLDPSNCKKVKVLHTSSALTSKFNSCVWLGPGFPDAGYNEGVQVVRKIEDDVCISVLDKSTGYLDYELHHGSGLPIAVLYKNTHGHKAFGQADHIEIDPKDLNESVYEMSYSSYRDSLKERNMEDIAEREYNSKKEGFLNLQQDLLASDQDRIAALRDELRMLDMPLK
jgi:hypothetical protein